ncbi:DUF4375 domain-containing protein [Neobacillus sp. PS3-34]|uniref:DMP19 family protein n=1 Tax=Neobacillus sp. PS3-34 TaxID=3070678 RepID=UPI0027DF4F9F|nr:DUF4375 domain-containing protein [Neobacillus sp. PS3-34]WML50228.1 DUF4375 domain-containing protein [Neobacillus sp. PS3-34]
MTIKIEVGYKKIMPIKKVEDIDIYESYDTTINFIYNNKSFFGNFVSITKDSEMAKYIHDQEWEGNAFTYHHENGTFPLFSMVMDMNFGLKHIGPYEVFVMTHDAYQSELVFNSHGEEIHIFFHLKYKGLWYDGNKIVFTRQVPEKSCFVVNANEFKQAIEDFIFQLREYLSTNHPELMKDPLVQRTFGFDKYFNDFFVENQTNSLISEMDDEDITEIQDLVNNKDIDEIKRVCGGFYFSEIDEKYLEISEKVHEKESEVGLKGLNSDERQFYLVDRLLMELNNGGFDQYLNSTGESWRETVNILEKLGLELLADLGNRANTIYLSNKSEDDKLDELSELDDEFYEMEYEETYKKLLTLLS